MSHARVAEALRAGDGEAAKEMLVQDEHLGRERGEPNLLMLALYMQQPEVASIIADRRDEFTFTEAVSFGRTDQVGDDLRSNDTALLAQKTNDGFTPLHLAAFFGHEAIARMLLDAGADVNAVADNDSRVTPLHSAAAARSTSIVEALLAKGADPNAQQSGGFTALHSASLHGLGEMADALLAAGADPELAAEDGRAPADFADEGGFPQLAAKLGGSP